MQQTDSLFTVINGQKTMRLALHCFNSPLFKGEDTTCKDLLPLPLDHAHCGQANYIDGNGYVHCACSQQRHLFDMKFECFTEKDKASDNCFHSRQNILKVKKSLFGTVIAHANESEFDELEDWIIALSKTLTKQAKARGFNA